MRIIIVLLSSIIFIIVALKWLFEDDYHQHGLHKNTEVEWLSLILQILPSSFSTEHNKGNQDNKKTYQELDIKAKLNIDVDEIATKTVSIPINTHIIFLPFALYIDDKYTHHRPDHSIRVHSREAQYKLNVNGRLWFSIQSTKIFIPLVFVPF